MYLAKNMTVLEVIIHMYEKLGVWEYKNRIIGKHKRTIIMNAFLGWP